MLGETMRLPLDGLVIVAMVMTVYCPSWEEGRDQREGKSHWLVLVNNMHDVKKGDDACMMHDDELQQVPRPTTTAQVGFDGAQQMVVVHGGEASGNERW